LPPTQLERFLSPLKILRSLSTDPDCPSSLLLRLVQVLPGVVTEEVEEEDEGVTEDVVATVGEVAEEEVGVELGLEPRRVVPTLSSSLTGTRVSSLPRARYVST
jgi:hypothetical protein